MKSFFFDILRLADVKYFSMYVFNVQNDSYCMLLSAQHSAVCYLRVNQMIIVIFICR